MLAATLRHDKSRLCLQIGTSAAINEDTYRDVPRVTRRKIRSFYQYDVIFAARHVYHEMPVRPRWSRPLFHRPIMTTFTRVTATGKARVLVPNKRDSAFGGVASQACAAWLCASAW